MSVGKMTKIRKPKRDSNTDNTCPSPAYFFAVSVFPIKLSLEKSWLLLIVNVLSYVVSDVTFVTVP